MNLELIPCWHKETRRELTISEWLVLKWSVTVSLLSGPLRAAQLKFSARV